jgi:hypothetical protein
MANRRRPTRPAWTAGMRMLCPGMYVDANRELQLAPEELCESLDIAPTQENCRELEDVVREAYRQVYGNPAATARKEQPCAS